MLPCTTAEKRKELLARIKTAKDKDIPAIVQELFELPWPSELWRKREMGRPHGAPIGSRKPRDRTVTVSA